LGPSMKPSTDVCKAAIIFLIVICPHTLASKSLYRAYAFEAMPSWLYPIS
jgi:hypothetical protein